MMIGPAVRRRSSPIPPEGRQQRPADVPHSGDAVAKHYVARNLTEDEMRVEFDKSWQYGRVAEVHLTICLAAQLVSRSDADNLAPAD